MKPERGGMRRGAGDACFAMKDQNARCGTAEGEKPDGWRGQGRAGQGRAKRTRHTYVDEFRLRKRRGESDLRRPAVSFSALKRIVAVQ